MDEVSDVSEIDDDTYRKAGNFFLFLMNDRERSEVQKIEVRKAEILIRAVSRIEENFKLVGRRERDNEITALREDLARLDHEQWMRWSKTLAQSEKLSKERVARWKALWIPYPLLSEKDKDMDRKEADLVLDSVLGHGGVENKDA
jgi:hypothetical protein